MGVYADEVYSGDGLSFGAIAAINSNKNILINGDFSVSQKFGDASTTVTAGAEKNYVVDMWYAYCTGADITAQRITGSGQSQYRYQLTGNTGNTAIQFGQRVEAARSYHLNGQTCTLSVDISNSLLTTVTWTAYYANTKDTFGTIASPTRTQIATGTFTVSSTLARHTTQIDIPSAAVNGIEIVFSVVNQTSGTWVIGDVQLEHGTVATEFERKDQLPDCLKSIEVFKSSAIAPNGFVMHTVTYANSATIVYNLEYSRKRSNTPSITFSNNGSGRYVHSTGIYSSVTATVPFSSSNYAIIVFDPVTNAGYGWMDNFGDVVISAYL